MTRAVVLDIEGTTSPTDSVRNDLYGYTEQRLPGWLAENATGAAESVLTATRELAGEPDADTDRVAEILTGWLHSDVKAEPLKAAQGAICAQGFRSGALHGRFFADVVPALSAWHAAGLPLYVYSSGSERNQRDWFAFAEPGDLSALITDHFDLVSAGPKREPASYEHIAARIAVPAANILFLSDHPDELDAAVTAGWQVIGVHREGEPNPPRAPHRWVGSFAEIEVGASA
ncbi:acireductone synthase [Nocardia asteroides NBRC 15531]|uniref:Enolase-phosphatase E1 n=1 Tax=Nocardia asteroides NBRC 15531 TaxID=1110697 RepID=U5EP02_NOCAS|nr:acireductone synthase [Nocardia asteroides]TLF70288.1 acireductone synthase [Nocardia asteroides NBRC 15531]UGT49815.1 acireductone synthase [Nocardia asteroides]SFM02005.1 acireductone synthase [Nocardia asteroides]VEG37434.1 Predicted enolase-phosphatase [Nocardia asteroides]BAO98990.1 enolase-phosphatase E1 [Nocardia asteroides NBRC 15531]